MGRQSTKIMGMQSSCNSLPTCLIYIFIQNQVHILCSPFVLVHLDFASTSASWAVLRLLPVAWAPNELLQPLLYDIFQILLTCSDAPGFCVWSQHKMIWETRLFYFQVCSYHIQLRWLKCLTIRSFFSITSHISY